MISVAAQNPGSFFANSGYSTRPANVKVAVGEPAEFKCGVPEGSSSLVFTFYSSHGNYSITCPEGHVEDIPQVRSNKFTRSVNLVFPFVFITPHYSVSLCQALFGSCDVKNGELLSVWRLQGTSYSDNGTKVECRQSENPEILIAILHVYGEET